MLEFIVLVLFAAGFYLLYNLMVKENGFVFKLLVHKKRRKSSKKSTLLWLLPWLLLLAYLFMAYNQYIFFASAVSDSMSPGIEKGDVVLMQTIDKTPRVGDIILFEGEDAPITHRVYGIEGNKVITKGDANPAPDAPIEKEKVLAKAVVIFNKPVVFRNLGYKQEDWRAPASMRIAAFTSINYRKHLLFTFGLAIVLYLLILFTGSRRFGKDRYE